MRRLLPLLLVILLSTTGMKCIVTGPNTATTVEGQHIDFPVPSDIDRLCDIAYGWLCPGWEPPQDWYWELQKYYHYDGTTMVLDGEQWVGGPCGNVFDGCVPSRVPNTYGFD